MATTLTAPLTGIMTQAAMEANAPRRAYVAFRYKGMFVDVVTVTRNPTEAADLYRAGVRNPESRSKRRATTHLYYRP